LLDRYDAVLLDLDGTVYRGGSAIEGAEQTIAAAHRAGVAVRYVTNNASRGPDVVSAQLRRLGIAASTGEVSTSAQAAARLLAEDRRLAPGADVLVVGTDALATEVRARGLNPVRAANAGTAAVVQGLSQDTSWRDLAEAAVAIRAGAVWIACNIDLTLPTERGLLPGNGSLVAALRSATGVEPVIAGKPARPLMDDAVAATGARRPLVVGDRLDTDIAGAVETNLEALLVLTGVSTAADLVAAPRGQRPRYVSADLRGLTGLAKAVEIGSDPAWLVDVDGVARRVKVHFVGSGSDQADPLDLLRTVCGAWWPMGTGPLGVDALDPVAERAARALHLE
jgi:HAD superfamily hydrolase (TIGR01450 family)